MKKSSYKEGKIEEFNYLLNGNLILLVTATDLETSNTHKKISPLNGHDKIIKIFEGDLTYYLGTFGSYNVAHVQSEMGSMARASSIMTVSTALSVLKSKVVIMVGIAFGIDEEKQSIGDVLLSESIIPYNAKRVGTETTISRGKESQCNKTLINRFKSAITGWDYPLPNGVNAKLIPTRLLSGEELIDNLDYRNELLSKFPESEGGEMEGAGVSSACDDKAAWIIIKGICDFADGLKAKNKKERQTIAINSALSVCQEVLNSPSAFDALEVASIAFAQPILSRQDININDILFDIYDVSKEPFYKERGEDKVFKQKIEHTGIWIYGPVGCGKSNLIYRNVIKENKKFIQISLQACVGLEIEDFFKEILYEVASKIGVTIQVQPRNFVECNKLLIELLIKHYSNQELILIIEEIPINTEEDYKKFAFKIFSILISQNLVNELNKLKIVLSSLNNPCKYIQDFQQKIYQQYSFIEFTYWDEKDFVALIALIERGLNFGLPENIRNDLINSCEGSPRFIKKFFRSVYTLSKTDESTLRLILNDTIREFKSFRNV